MQKFGAKLEEAQIKKLGLGDKSLVDLTFQKMEAFVLKHLDKQSLEFTDLSDKDFN